MNGDPMQPLDLTSGNTARERARTRRARRYFHQTLAAELKDRGAATVGELYFRLACFLLPLEDNEIKQVVESARREGVVAEVKGERDGYGKEVVGQWAPTEEGHGLSRPRAMALHDLGYRIAGEHDRLVKVFDSVKTGLTAALPLLPLLAVFETSLSETKAAEIAAFVASGAVLLWILASGVKGELDLRAAAFCWPRLARDRPQRWDYQMSWARTFALPGLVAVAYAMAGAWFIFEIRDAPYYLICAAVAGLIYYEVAFRPYLAWHKHDHDLCREKWERRSNDREAAQGNASKTSVPRRQDEKVKERLPQSRASGIKSRRRRLQGWLEWE